MKKTLLNAIPDDFPCSARELTMNAKIYDSSCSPEARVYFVDKDDGYYIKKAKLETLKKEAEMTSYFHGKGLGTNVVAYISDSYDWLITAKVQGEDCTHMAYLDNPKRLCDTIATELRALHELAFSDCPIQDRLSDYFSLAEENHRKNLYDTTLFTDDFIFSSAEEAYREFSQGKEALKSEVLLHGDYCLPNIILDNWRLSSFIDLGNGGVGDRHIDVFWGIWTLQFNLKTNKYKNRFIDAYGRDKIDEELLRVIAAAEVFG